MIEIVRNLFQIPQFLSRSPMCHIIFNKHKNVKVSSDLFPGNLVSLFSVMIKRLEESGCVGLE